MEKILGAVIVAFFMFCSSSFAEYQQQMKSESQSFTELLLFHSVQLINAKEMDSLTAIKTIGSDMADRLMKIDFSKTSKSDQETKERILNLSLKMKHAASLLQANQLINSYLRLSAYWQMQGN